MARSVSLSLRFSSIGAGVQTLSVLCLTRLYANTANTGQLEQKCSRSVPVGLGLQECSSGPWVPGQGQVMVLGIICPFLYATFILKRVNNEKI